MSKLLANLMNYVKVKIHNQDKPHSTMERKFSLIEIKEYYKYLREEIQREDAITTSRISSLLTFQGFLVSAVGLLMTGAWPNPDSCLGYGITSLREHLLWLIGGVGLLSAAISIRGILASYRALDTIKDEWEDVLASFDDQEANVLAQDKKSKREVKMLMIFPRAYGPRNALGGYSGRLFPFAFILIWTVYLLYCFTFINHVSWPILHSPAYFRACFPKNTERRADSKVSGIKAESVAVRYNVGQPTLFRHLPLAPQSEGRVPEAGDPAAYIEPGSTRR